MLYISNGPVTGDEPRVKIPPPSLLRLSGPVSRTEDSNFSIMPQLGDSLVIASDPTVAIPSPKKNATDEAVDD